METQYCMVAKALKPGLRCQLYNDVEEPAPSQHVLLDDLFPNGAVSSEDFLSVDCFLDFPVGHEGDDRNNKIVEDEEEKDSASVFSQEDNASNISSGSFLSSELAVPDDDIAGLEWVSHFVDDSSCELSLLVPSNTEMVEGHVNRFEPGRGSLALGGFSGRTSFLFPYQVPAKARTKRTRPTRANRTWSAGAPSAESSSLSSATSSSFPTPCLVASGGPVQPMDSDSSSLEPVPKKQKKGHPGRTNVGDAGLNQFQRRCTHCQVQKTPQWRTGPLGPKTLCNACGVRYKSGRLFPEYRPACSPTFSSDLHSNSHRKVLEMRSRKEMGEPARFTQMIPSF